MLTRQRPLPSPDFKLELELPRTTYNPGDTINYKVIVDNPHGIPIEFLNIALYQTMVIYTTKRRGKGRSSTEMEQGSFKVTTDKMVSRTSGPGFVDTTWEDNLQVPSILPPTTRPSGSSDVEYLSYSRDGSRVQERIAEITYFLQVQATQCESFSLVSEDFPIEIKLPTLPTAVGGQTTSCSSDLPPHPPRYSSLSLKAPSLGGLSSSCETLPPDYEDMMGAPENT